MADDKGEKHEATEWYQVPLEIIDSIIQKIMNGSIIYFSYNKEQQCLEQRIEKKPSQLNLSGLKVLTLIIEKVYFEEIVFGVKTEEYRSLKQTTLNKYTYIDEADGKRYSEKKSQYPADGAGYCDFTFLLYKSFLFDTFFYRLQYVVENLIGVAERDEVALKL